MSLPPATTTVSAAAVHIDALSHTYPAPRRTRRKAAKPSPEPAPTGPVRALDDVSFDIQPGEIFGVLGPNGGGKTTLFRILATMMRPDSGTVRIFSDDLLTQPDRVRTHLGVVFQYPSVDGKLTARENLIHQANLYGIARSEVNARVHDWLTRFSLADRADDFVEQFSGGMRRRVELAKAMLHDPRLLLLDEPDTGLDPGARSDLWQQLRMLREERGMTIVLTTHLMEQADRCDRLAVLNKGRLVALDTPARLKAMIGGEVITVAPRDDAAALCDVIIERFGPWDTASRPRVVDGAVKLAHTAGMELVSQITAALGDRIQSITVGQPTLEDVFLHLTGHTLWSNAG